MIQIDAENPDPASIQEAAAVLRRGGLVVFPTETVYGLGANLQDPQAIQELYQVKQRPFEKQVTVHIADWREPESHGVIVTPLAKKLMNRFWPGPLTLILSRPDRSTLGFRMPSHPVALALLKAAGVPVVATSANLSGNPPPRKAQDILPDLADKVDFLLDAGPAPVGIESTVVDLSSDRPRILRRGAKVQEIEAAIQEGSS